ncbi:MAG: hypothetical protein F6K55_13540 [Moorea sp. SIO4A3]|nr:hypothetical protein [Moorena sp. SIO4A3]
MNPELCCCLGIYINFTRQLLSPDSSDGAGVAFRRRYANEVFLVTN